MLEEERLAVQGVDRNVLSTARRSAGRSGATRTPARQIGGAGGTDHLTRVSDSFLGQICSNVSGVMFHCERMLLRIDRWTDDLTLTWPETSAEGWNLTIAA